MPPLEHILGLLEGVRGNDQQWTARCPAHEDRSPSLSVSANDQGDVLLHCHAGCDFGEIMTALGLDVKDAFASRGKMTEGQRLAAIERRLRELERKQQEHEERLTKLEELRRSQVHLVYYRNLTPTTRQLWYQEGIYDEAIDHFQLGFVAQCPAWPESPSLTIPVFGYEGDLENIRHRLLRPGQAGKYRPQMPGLGQQLFNAVVLQQSHEQVLVLEGEKKTIVFDQAGYPAVGIMGQSAMWRDEWFLWFDVGRVIICFDPGAEESARQLGKRFRQQRFADVRLAHFPTKPDDLIVRVGAGKRHVDRILELARPVK